jgi:hypothetical protein
MLVTAERGTETSSSVSTRRVRPSPKSSSISFAIVAAWLCVIRSNPPEFKPSGRKDKRDAG